MPFITKDKRLLCDKDIRFAEDKGDLCYLIYKDLMAGWNKQPRWATLHEIYKTMIIDTYWLFKFRCNDRYTREDAIAALHLAWQVFFQKVVMPYELQKEEQNGPIS